MQPQREQLRIYLRRRQIVNETGNVVINCALDNTASYVPGTVDQTWLEFTRFTEGLDKLTLDWDKINSGTSGETTETNQAGSNYDKGISLSLLFTNDAFLFIRDWLDINPCSTLNSIEVLVTDYLCKDFDGVPKNYRKFEIKADNLTYMPFGAPCEYEIKLREQDAVWHCIHKTFIWDNWQEWFIDSGSKQHPCFLTGVESRPRLLSSVRFGATLWVRTMPPIGGAAGAVILGILLDNSDDVYRRIQNVDNFVDAPLVRDIISNVCDKCGIAVDTMFHDPAEPYYNLCLYYPSAGAMHQSDGSAVTSPSLFFHFDNRWNITLAEFLDKLKPIFNAEWYVTPNDTLVFKPKAEFLNVPPIFDFTLAINAEKWDKYSLRYTFNGNKKPAYGRYQYTIDAADLASQEAQPLYNDLVDYDGPANNLMLEGNIAKNFEFASTGAIKDGRAKREYLRQTVNDGEAIAYVLIILLAVVTFSLIGGGVTFIAAGILLAICIAWAALIAAKANDLRDEFDSPTYWGAVRLTAEETATPRLLLWDGDSLDRAKMVAQISLPTVNAFYNPDAVNYTTRNKFQYTPAGFFNYPMYFDSYFTNNLYDGFHHSIDNPILSLVNNQTFELNAFLCCEMLDLLGVWEGDFAKIGYFVKLEERPTMDIFGRIEHFTVDYGNATINIKGQVYRVIREPVDISVPDESFDISFPGESESASDPGVSEPSNECCDPTIIAADAETTIPDPPESGSESEPVTCCTPVVLSAEVETIADDSGSESGSQSESESVGDTDGIMVLLSAEEYAIKSLEDLTFWNTFYNTAINADAPFDEIILFPDDLKIVLKGPGELILENGWESNPGLKGFWDNAGIVTETNGSFVDCANLEVVELLFTPILGDGTFASCPALVSVSAPLATSLGAVCFQFCSALVNISLPAVVSTGINCFQGCTSLEDISLPACTDLGGTTGDNNVFAGITGQTITLTIPTATETDGDVVELQANNAVTLILV